MANVAGNHQPAGARPPALNDVGRRAGVSHQTVSRVLNGHPNVRPETRARVLKAVSELGYRRNTAARALVTRKSAIIGVITNGSPHFGPSSTFQSVELAARDAGYFVSVASVRTQDRQSLALMLDHFMSQAVEGIVVIAPQDFAAEAVADAAGQLPTVVVADAPHLTTVVHVSVDQAVGAELAMTHLINQGNRTIAHIAGPLDWFDAAARVNAWRSCLDRAGLPPGRLLQGDWTAESGYRAAVSLLGSGLPDAVFAANDMMALGVLRAFREHGISVPDDVSVVGFDDADGSAHFDPPLTTVRQEFESLGPLAVRSLRDWIASGGPTPTSSQRIRPRLIVRETSAKMRAGIGLRRPPAA
ncbi:MAG TPA: LacI family DNA-binding transcriptional regulator [Nakamurella sp.]